MKTKTKLSTNSPILTAFAEAWRTKQVAEKALDAVKEDMQNLLQNGPQDFTYADGAKVTFNLIAGNKTAPVSIITARELTGFTDAKLLKIAGTVDAKKIDALMELGQITRDVRNSLLPVNSYLQIRGNFAKN